MTTILWIIVAILSMAVIAETVAIILLCRAIQDYKFSIKWSGK